MNPKRLRERRRVRRSARLRERTLLATEQLPDSPLVAVSMAVRKVERSLVERAISSILEQSWPHLRMVVTYDGERAPDWLNPSDSRMTIWSTKQRRGPYFAHELCRRAVGAPLFAVQDADDHSDPDRLALLVRAHQREELDAAVPTVLEHHGSRIREISPTPRAPHGRLPYRLDHFWVIRSSTVDAIGSYYSGHLCGTDTLLTALVLDHGIVAGVPAAKYHRVSRPGSLTNAADTGQQSALRRRTAAALAAIYERSANGLEGVRGSLVTAAEQAGLLDELDDLRKAMR